MDGWMDRALPALCDSDIHDDHVRGGDDRLTTTTTTTTRATRDRAMRDSERLTMHLYHVSSMTAASWRALLR